MFLTHYYKYCGTIKEFKIDTNIVCTHICELISSYSIVTWCNSSCGVIARENDPEILKIN